jgi:hypothetical protein
VRTRLGDFGGMKETMITESRPEGSGRRDCGSRGNLVGRGMRAAEWMKSKWFDNWLRIANEARRNKAK